MEGRDLVLMVFEEGEGPRPPLHFESSEKDLEALLSDVLLGHAWVPRWSKFFTEGGPLARMGRLSEWIENFDVDSYDWPDVSEVVHESLSAFERDVEGRREGKFVIFEVIGPTEQCEYFLMPPQPESARRLGLARHRFDFALLYKLSPSKARDLWARVVGYVLELAKAGAELDYVDAVRIADDCASYGGPLYPPEFYEELYFPAHRALVGEVERRGKFSVLHCDGDISSIIGELASLYDALHPLDVRPKSTRSLALEWVRAVAELRRDLGRGVVFFTGMPIELFMDPEIPPSSLLEVVEAYGELHGFECTVLATTHRPYPGRSFGEEGVREKVEAIRRLFGLPTCTCS